GGYVLSSSAPLERSLVVGSSVLTILEVAIIAAIATLFSSFSTPFLGSLLTVWMVLIGRSADSMARMPKKVFGEALVGMFQTLSTVVPNLHLYVPDRPLLTGEAAEADLWAYIGMASLQSLGWSLGLLAVAAFIFQRRDF